MVGGAAILLFSSQQHGVEILQSERDCYLVALLFSANRLADPRLRSSRSKADQQATRTLVRTPTRLWQVVLCMRSGRMYMYVLLELPSKHTSE